MKDQERLDIFDEKEAWIGTASRRDAHAKGLWHQTFQCWVLTQEEGEPALLFQLRQSNKDTFSNLLDISSAGHLLAGETVQDGLRELEEELGLSVPFEALIPCGTYAGEDLIAPELIDREFCRVFLLPWDAPVLSYRVQVEEVAGLFRISLVSWKRMVAGEASEVEAVGFVLDESDRPQPAALRVGMERFVPHPRDYYELVFRQADKWLGQMRDK